MQRIAQLAGDGWKGILFLSAAVLLIYGNTLNHSYNMDDELVTIGHRHTSKGISGIADIFSSPYYENDQGYSYEYRPVTHVSFALEHQFFGESARMSHLINVLLFVVTCLLVHRFCSDLLPSPYGSFALIAGLLFLVHPMHSEAVASIKNRDELLSLLFGILAIRWSGNVRRPVVLGAICLAAFSTLSLLSKFSFAPLLMLIPSFALLRGHSLSRVAMLSAVIITVFSAFLWLRDWPVQWMAVSGFGTLAGVLTVWSAMNIGLIGERLRSLATFSLPMGHIGLNPVTSFKEALALTMALTPFFLFLYFNERVFLLGGIVVPFAAMFWTGRLNVTIWLLAVMSASLWHAGSAANCLFVGIGLTTVLILEQGKEQGRRVKVTVTGVVAIAHMASGLVSRGSLETPLMSALLYLPIAIHYLTGRTQLSRYALVILVASGVVAFIARPGLDDALSVIALAGYSLIIGPSFSLRIFSRPPLFALTSLAAMVACLVLVNELSRPDNLSHRTQAAQVAQSDVAESTVTLSAIEARPLTFTEYPLGFDADLSTRLGTASSIMGHYLKVMFFPWPQAFYYGFDEVPLADMKNLWAIASAFIHLTLLLLALVYARSHAVLSFGLISYVASIFLFSNLVSPVAGMIADRLTYVSSFGFCVALGYVFHILFERFNSGNGRRAVTAALVLLLIGWGGMTIARNAQWKDALTLMRHDIKHVPKSAQAHNLLASHLMKNSFEPEHANEAMNMRREALQHFKESVGIWPGYLNVWYDMGRVHLLLNEPAKALICFKEAHRLDPTFYNATLKVAELAEQLGNHATAIEYYERCIRFNPEMEPPYNNLSYLYFREGRYEESIAVNDRAIRFNPKWPNPYLNMAKTYTHTGQPEKAREVMERYTALGH